MLETLFPLAFPPGIRHTGTVYQSKGRWYDGNGIRFHQGAIQPVGGWVQRTLTGTAISGTPNAAFAWQTNDGASYLAVGTTNGLYIVTTSNQVYDITPNGPSALTTGALKWQLSNFGQYLIASCNQVNGDTPAINYFYWNAVLGQVASLCVGPYLGPSNVYGSCVTAERFMVVLRGADLDQSDVSGPFTPVAGRVD